MTLLALRPLLSLMSTGDCRPSVDCSMVYSTGEMQPYKINLFEGLELNFFFNIVQLLHYMQNVPFFIIKMLYSNYLLCI